MSGQFLQSCASDALASLLRPIYGGSGCIVCLHRVIPEDERSSFAENRALEIAPETLRKILEWTRERGLDPIALDAVPERLARPRRRKFVAFTLDDGYRDNLTRALPVFREFDVPFTVNVTTGFVAGTEGPWWYALEGLLVARDPLSFRWKGEAHEFRCRDQACREKVFNELAKMIRGTGWQERGELLETLFSGTDAATTGFAKSLMLSWSELRTLAADRIVTIGAHTVGHHTLNRLSDAEAQAEMAESKRDLETRLGREVRHLAFPFGGRNAVGGREFALAEKCGFVTATTTRSGNLFHAHSRHLHCLPRIGVSGNYYPATTRLRKVESGMITAVAQRGRRVVTE